MVKCCFNCVFASELSGLPFIDTCDIDEHEITDAFEECCDEFIDIESDIKTGYMELLVAARERSGFEQEG